MHEMALTESVVRVIEEHAVAGGYRRVRAVRLEIGALSSVDPQALEFCYAAVARGTVAEGSRLEILRIAGAAWCAACAETVPVARRFDPCPRCGAHGLAVTAGDEMRIKELEVE